MERINMIFNRQKIKHLMLESMFKETSFDSFDDTEHVNVFINLDSILRAFPADKYEALAKLDKQKTSINLISNIVNFAAHYRMFFNKQKVRSSIYFYMGHPYEPDYINSTFNPDYRKYYYNKYVVGDAGALGRIINDALPILETVIDFLPRVYFIKSNVIEPSVLPLLVNMELEGRSIVITNDDYDYILGSIGFTVIRAFKQKIVCPDTLMDTIMLDNKTHSEFKPSVLHLPFIYAFLGDIPRNIPKLTGVRLSEVLGMLEEATNKGIITDKTVSHTILDKVVNPKVRDIVKNNLVCTDILYQLAFIPTSEAIRINTSTRNRFDNEGLIQINNELFFDYPLMILEIQELGNRIKKKNIFSEGL